MRAIDADRVKREIRKNKERIVISCKQKYIPLSLVYEILNKAPTLTPPNEWVSVEDALPPNMDDVLVVVQNNGECWTVTGYYSKTSKVWYAVLNGYDTQMDVLWWMPLPAPPDHFPNSTKMVQGRPNEPLTLEQLRKMDGEPVWVTPLGFWALVIAKHDERVKLISNDGEIVYADKEIELVGPVYRRPPEGGEDT